MYSRHWSHPRVTLFECRADDTLRSVIFPGVALLFYKIPIAFPTMNMDHTTLADVPANYPGITNALSSTIFFLFPLTSYVTLHYSLDHKSLHSDSKVYSTADFLGCLFFNLCLKPQDLNDFNKGFSDFFAWWCEPVNTKKFNEVNFRKWGFFSY